jgi:hypothetical protein
MLASSSAASVRIRSEWRRLAWTRLARSAALAAVAIDVADMLSAAIEAGKRSGLEDDLAGGLIFSAAGVVTAATALRASE